MSRENRTWGNNSSYAYNEDEVGRRGGVPKTDIEDMRYHDMLPPEVRMAEKQVGGKPMSFLSLKTQEQNGWTPEETAEAILQFGEQWAEEYREEQEELIEDLGRNMRGYLTDFLRRIR